MALSDATATEKLQQGVTLSGAVNGLDEVVDELYSTVYGSADKAEEGKTPMPASKLLYNIDRIQNLTRRIKDISRHLSLLE